MKKALLLSGLLAAGVPAMWSFDAPTICESTSFQGISPNGRYLASSLFGTVVIYDLEAGVQYDYVGSEYGEPFYSEGLGNYVSNTGVVLGSTTSESDAAYWENGEWHQLETPLSEGVSNLSNGVTPDGSRICGSVGLAPVSVDGNSLMMAPAYWDRQADGTYGTCNVLPYPTVDQTGRLPQYVTANYISEDGKTIAGQIRDCRGFVHIPIVYIQDDSGEWSYTIVAKDTFYSADFVFPEYPGDGPEYPAAENYLEGDDKAAYDEAYQKFVDSGDWSLYPAAEDFLTGDAKGAFEAAKAEYEAWELKFNAYTELYDQYMNAVPQFNFNDVKLSPDGKTYYSASLLSDYSDPLAWSPTIIGTPCAIDIESGEIKKYEFDKSLYITAVPNDEVLLVSSGVGSMPMEGYLIKDDELIPVQDYLGALSPDLKTWVDDNLVHELETVYDEETESFIYESLYVTGNLLASADLKIMSMWNDCPWDNMAFACGYVFDLGQFAGVSAPVAGNGGVSVSFDAMGNLVVEGDVVSVELYDLLGRCVLSLDAPAGVVANDLAAGVYVAKAVTQIGVVTSKIAK